MIGIPIGLLYSNAAEWWIHKRLLHALGKNKSSIWNFHRSEHHRNVRNNGFHDPEYNKPFWDRRGPRKEVLGVLGLMALHLPLAPIAPWFTATVVYSGYNFIRKHKKAHLDPEWAYKNLRCHYDHHMGKNQDANFSITQPWFDHLIGTRVNYKYDEDGTPHSS